MPIVALRQSGYERAMSARPVLVAVCLSVAAAGALAGCAERMPYLYKAAEFDRSQADFARDPATRTEAIVCYARTTTTPAAVQAIAEEACAKVGKRAVFTGHVTTECPLVIPAAARFACVAR